MNQKTPRLTYMKFYLILLGSALVLMNTACEGDSSGNEVSTSNDKQMTSSNNSNQSQGNDNNMNDSGQMDMAHSNDDTPEQEHSGSMSDSDKNSGEDNMSMPMPNEGMETGGQSSDTQEPPKQDTYNFHEYKKLASFLKKHVSGSGKVSYSTIKGDVASLNGIIKEFESNYPEGSWTKNQKLVYWINAYNVYTIKLITDNYPYFLNY